jgi:hypothetical protein
MDRHGRSWTVIRNTEKRKVGSSTLPLTTSTGYVSNVLTSDNVNLGHKSRERGGSPCCPIVTASRRAMLHVGCTQLTMGVDVMPPAEVPARVQAIADFFVPLWHQDATMILGLVGAARFIPDGWESAPNRIKFINIQRILINLPDDALVLLKKLIFDNELILEKALADYFATLSEVDANNTLKLVGSYRHVPSGWRLTSKSTRSIVARKILMDMPNDEVELLMEFLPIDELERFTGASISVPEPAIERVASPPPSPLTPREYEIAELAASGLTNEAIADELSISPATTAVRVLERGTGRDVIVLHEQANKGRTILEKFEDHAAGSSFAVVLLTADDEGGVRTTDNRHLRGRQNVIFELGFFFGKLGRRRVAVLLEENVEKPSDIAGLVYITLDSAGAWKQKLAQELEAADIKVDRARIPY